MFMKLPFPVFDSGLAAAVEPRLLMAYYALQRNVWRSASRGHPEMKRRFEAGQLVARIGQSKLAALIGLRRRQSVSGFVRDMVHLTWVEIVPLGAGRALAYKLGRVEKALGKTREVYAFDEWLRALGEHVEKSCTKTLPLAQRQDIIRAFVERGRGVRPGAPVRRGERNVSHAADTREPNVCGAPDSMNRERSRKAKRDEHHQGAGQSSSRADALEALDEMQRTGTTVDSWSLAALFGWFVECWETRFKRTWDFTPAHAAKVVRDLEGLERRVGMVDAVGAVDVVFGSQWIRNGHLRFLTDRDRYSEHIVPKLADASS